MSFLAGAGIDLCESPRCGCVGLRGFYRCSPLFPALSGAAVVRADLTCRFGGVGSPRPAPLPSMALPYSAGPLAGRSEASRTYGATAPSTRPHRSVPGTTVARPASPAELTPTPAPRTLAPAPTERADPSAATTTSRASGLHPPATAAPPRRRPVPAHGTPRLHYRSQVRI